MLGSEILTNHSNSLYLAKKALCLHSHSVSKDVKTDFVCFRFFLLKFSPSQRMYYFFQGIFVQHSSQNSIYAVNLLCKQVVDFPGRRKGGEKQEQNNIMIHSVYLLLGGAECSVIHGPRTDNKHWIFPWDSRRMTVCY